MVEIPIDSLNTFIGKNDIGKSTIMEALDIFFNKDGVVSIDDKDPNINSGSKLVTIMCDFTSLPESIILDSGEPTTLAQEYLTIAHDTIRIKKVFDCSKKKPTEEMFVVCNHPTASQYDNLLSLKEKDLQSRIKNMGLESPLKGNPQMRQAIWKSAPDLMIDEVEISVTKGKEDAKAIGTKIENYFPTYALFQSDRSSQDSDSEVQNPMKAAIQEALSEVSDEINDIENKVREKALEIAERTHRALESIDSYLASQLMPNFTQATPAKWTGLFSVGLDTDAGISLNKRGSGVRRMILVGFFKAEAEHKSQTSNKKDVIYAIEEPETAQHPDNQKILINSFKQLAENDNCQVLLTTHSPELAKELPVDSIRFIGRADDGKPFVESGSDEVFQEVVKTLGVLADPATINQVKVLICVEGPTDVVAMKSFSRCLREKDDSVVDLENDPRIAIIPTGGSILKYWVEKQYLKNLKCKEFHLYDNDVKQYQKSVDEVNARNDGSFATLTQKREIENYLNKKAIKQRYGVDVDTTLDGVPKLFGEAFAVLKHFDKPMGDNKSKTYLSKVFNEFMSYDLLMEIDSDGEVKSWFDRIKTMLDEE